MNRDQADGCWGRWCARLLRKNRGKDKEIAALKQELSDAIDACASIYDFCWPDNNWRGENNMKGILDAMQPVRFVICHHRDKIEEI